MSDHTTKVERLWRCPVDGRLYKSPDLCARICFLPGSTEHETHQPVTRTTTVVVTEGHDD